MSLSQHIVKTLKASKGLTKAELRAKSYAIRSYSAEQLDAALSYAARTGKIEKTKAVGKGKSKFVYSVPKVPSVASIILNSLVGKTRIDSLEVLQIVKSVRTDVKKNLVDATLHQLSEQGKILKSKSDMTDTNVISSQSKFVYGGKPKFVDTKKPSI